MSELHKEHHRLHLDLEEAERLSLEEASRHHPRPAVRERAAALLKVAQGMSPHAVARQGLLRSRDPDTVYQWVRHFQQEGLASLVAHRHGGNQRGHL